MKFVYKTGSSDCIQPALNKEKENISTLLTETKRITDGITGDIVHVTSRMDMLKQSVHNTEEYMHQISDGSSDISNAVQVQLVKTEDIQNYVENVQEVSRTIVDDMERTGEAIEKGKEKIDDLINKAKLSEESSGMVSERLKELDGNTKQMNSIVELIQSVTKQTSLLSLNASIEAARAGEAGRGFAVVAGEISNLASQTSTATTNITSLIQSISSSLSEVIDSVTDLVEHNRHQNQVATETADHFANIEKNAKNMSVLSKELTDVISHLSGANEGIVASIQNISGICQEVTAKAVETSEASINDGVVVGEVVSCMDELNSRAREYQHKTKC